MSNISEPSAQVVLFTDFGSTGPYPGQVKSVLYSVTPSLNIIDLLNDVPSFLPRAAGYLLAAYCSIFPKGTVFLAIVDPGVGSARLPIVVESDGYFFVGPDNELFNALAAQNNDVIRREIIWRPSMLTNTFHGRDLFAPVAAKLASGELPNNWLGCREIIKSEAIPPDLDELIYIDPFGNVVTGLRGVGISEKAILVINSYRLRYSNTFCDVGAGKAFWYRNANGLVEIAVNQGNAAQVLALAVGDKFVFV